eukprot:scaffold58661_cov30-Tisochrysis_lutea.AAC.1
METPSLLLSLACVRPPAAAPASRCPLGERKETGAKRKKRRLGPSERRREGRARASMIQFIVLQNRQGKTRLSKYYRSYTDEEKAKIEGEIHRIVTTRDPKFTNFVE